MKLRGIAALAGALLTALALPASGMAATGQVTEFPLPALNSQPYGITGGPDGNVWAALKGGVAKPIVRITPAGVLTDFPTEPGSTPYDITAGPDGNVYFTDQGTNKVGKVTPAGVYTGFAGLGLNGARGIATGPDGHLYVVDTNNNQIAEINPATGTKVVGIPIPSAASNPQEITLGPDGNMWFTETTDPGKVGRVNLGVNPKTITEFTVGKSDFGISSGPDGKVYFTEASGDPKVSRINTDGTGYQSTARLAGTASDPDGLALGRDGNLYTAVFNTAQVGQVTPNPFAVNLFKNGVSGTMGPRIIAKGPDGNMWYSSESQNKIGRFTVDPPTTNTGGGGTTSTTGGGSSTGGGSNGGGGGTTDTSSPTVSSVSASPSRFRVGPQATAVSAAADKTGTTFTYSLSKDARVTLTIEQATAGRKKGRTCAKPSRSNRKGKRCVRYAKKGTLTRSGQKGQNEVAFSGRIGSKALKPGHYRVGIAGTDSAGQTGTTQYAKFTVLANKKVVRHKKK